jgi:hypothetical protein
MAEGCRTLVCGYSSPFGDDVPVQICSRNRGERDRQEAYKDCREIGGATKPSSNNPSSPRAAARPLQAARLRMR